MINPSFQRPRSCPGPERAQNKRLLAKPPNSLACIWQGRNESVLFRKYLGKEETITCFLPAQECRSGGGEGLKSCGRIRVRMSRAARELRRGPVAAKTYACDALRAEIVLLGLMARPIWRSPAAWGQPPPAGGGIGASGSRQTIGRPCRRAQPGAPRRSGMQKSAEDVTNEIGDGMPAAATHWPKASGCRSRPFASHRRASRCSRPQRGNLQAVESLSMLTNLTRH